MASATELELSRYRCRAHFLARAIDRGIEIADLARLESRIAAMREAFQRPGVDRHLIRMKLAGAPVRIIWDDHLGCVVTIWNRHA